MARSSAKAAFPPEQDPLGQTLAECEPSAELCRGRIPSGVAPAELLVRDLTDGVHVAFTFNGGTISNAVLGRSPGPAS